jgi:methionyl-tRNA synthetase
MTERIGVFVAWPYANGPLHIGHIGGSLLPPDIFARYHRLRGADVMMVSGSDTHGTPITVKAEEEGRSPREVFEKWHLEFLDTFEWLGISFDLFTHTDTANHHAIAQQLFTRLNENGGLYVAAQEQLYAPQQGRYLPDRFVEGTCPHCGYDRARGDQCDDCGRMLNATELIEPRARFGGGEALEVHERDHFFLDLPKYADGIAEWISGLDGWRPAVRNSSLGQIREGLEARAISRDLDWGIQVPVEGWDDKVLYVWFEAVMGYLSASVELAALRGDSDGWHGFWYDPQAGAYYFMGKDNTVFHAIMWPAILTGAQALEAGDAPQRFNLPSDVVANEYVNLEGDKMSTGRNWALWMPDLRERYAPDVVRYYLTINAPETRDVDFTWDDFVRATNNELLATWGNLVNRVLKFTVSKADGVVPEPGPLSDVDEAILERTASAFETVGTGIEARRFKVALADAMAVAHDVNRYLNEKAPWAQIKVDETAARTTLYVALRAIDDLKTLLAPFLPHTSQLVHEYLGYSGKMFGRTYVDRVGEGDDAHAVLRYDGSEATGAWAPSQLPIGQALCDPAPLFEKLDEEATVAEERARLRAQSRPE